jgi:hypothetical protein
MAGFGHERPYGAAVGKVRLRIKKLSFAQRA